MKLLLFSLLLIFSLVQCATPPDGYKVWSNPSQALSDPNIGKWFTTAVNYYIYNIARQPFLRYQSIVSVASSTQFVLNVSNPANNQFVSGQRVQYDCILQDSRTQATQGLIMYVSYPLNGTDGDLESAETYSYP